MEIIDADEYEESLPEPVTEDEMYKEFMEDEGVPIHSGLYVKDIYDLSTGPWERTGEKGAFLDLYGMQRLDDLQLHELTPAGATSEQRHFYDELVYVLEGRGSTIIGDEKQFEWQEGSLFYIPINARYRHLNNSNEESAKLISQTYLPQLMNMIKDKDAIFNNDYNPFAQSGDVDYDDLYESEGGMTKFSYYEKKYDEVPFAWDATFIPNLHEFDAVEEASWALTGSLKSIHIPFPGSGMYAHVAEMPVGTYKNAHRHGPGANIFILEGEGYDLLWTEEMDAKIKIEWGPGTLFTPPANWFHQHFNTYPEPAKQFALHGPRFGSLNRNDIFDGHADRNRIDYYQEEPGIRELYEKELRKKDMDSQMPEECYHNPDYEFIVG